MLVVLISHGKGVQSVGQPCPLRRCSRTRRRNVRSNNVSDADSATIGQHYVRSSIYTISTTNEAEVARRNQKNRLFPAHSQSSPSMERPINTWHFRPFSLCRFQAACCATYPIQSQAHTAERTACQESFWQVQSSCYVRSDKLVLYVPRLASLFSFMCLGTVNEATMDGSTNECFFGGPTVSALRYQWTSYQHHALCMMHFSPVSLLQIVQRDARSVVV